MRAAPATQNPERAKTRSREVLAKEFNLEDIPFIILRGFLRDFAASRALGNLLKKTRFIRISVKKDEEIFDLTSQSAMNGQ